MEISVVSLFSSFLFPTFLLFFFFLFLFKRCSSTPTPPNYAPLKRYPVVGNIPYLIKNSHRILDWSAQLIPLSPTGTVTVAPFVFTANPANVEHVSKTRFANYHKPEPIIAAISDCLGRGLATTNGTEWRLHRKAATNEFSTASLRAFAYGSACHTLTAQLLPLLLRVSRSGEVLDLTDALERFAFDHTCSLVFGEGAGCLGGEGGCEGDRFFCAFETAARLCVERAKQPFTLAWRIKKWLRVGSERRLREAMEIVHAYVNRRMRRRPAADSSGGRDDLISRFTAGGHSEEFVRNNLISFVLAGRDTTPSALTWFFWVLSSRLDVVAQIREEIERIRSGRRQGETLFTLDDLRQMNYLQAAISETLRLYPPVPLVPRECLEDDELPDGARVRRGWVVMYNAHAMGRREALWGRDCEEYRPERWLEEGVFRPRSSSVYPAFHAGARACVGKEVAYLVMKMVGASVLEKFDVEVVEASGRRRLLMAMKMEGGLQVKLKQRRA
ncbi:cytochrome P450 CYP94D108-like [Curcuma longa]|uniref:cytochrome P450 CYP94D108-like n=1 Tax=Curcuma longa TaxID=136217 RepID=UPI003D9F5F02